MTDVEYGYCHCGCGEKTTICDRTRPERGMVKGEPRKYINHHFSKTQEFKGAYGDRAERFWSKVNKDTPNGCWLWTAGTRKGYGIFHFTSGSTFAHRVAWILTHGDIPSSVDVCHNCPNGDNKLCVNPAHMFIGTRSDNTKDLWAKGKGVLPPRGRNKGERQGKAKLTDEKVIELRRRHANGESVESLIEFAGVNDSTTWKAIHRHTWKHLP